MNRLEIYANVHTVEKPGEFPLLWASGYSREALVSGDIITLREGEDPWVVVNREIDFAHEVTKLYVNRATSHPFEFASQVRAGRYFPTPMIPHWPPKKD